MKQHKEMLGAVRRGDKIVTGGGIVGTVTKVIDDAEVTVEIAEGVRVRVQRALISSVLSKTEPVGEAKPPKQSDGGGGGASENAPQTAGSKLKKLFGGKGD
jgi:preprotein translocase subunit YajC